jgi:hypothetical protein
MAPRGRRNEEILPEEVSETENVLNSVDQVESRYSWARDKGEEVKEEGRVRSLSSDKLVNLVQ